MYPADMTILGGRRACGFVDLTPGNTIVNNLMFGQARPEIAAHVMLGMIKAPRQVPLHAKHVAPALGHHATRKIECKPHVNEDTLSESEANDLKCGITAVEAVWRSIQSDPHWLACWPMNRCILVALMVRDTLRGLGRSDAKVLAVGSQHLQFFGGKLLNSMTTGCPSARKIRGLWNAHMVVRIGDIVLDPSCGQTQRFWNAAPDAAALLIQSGLKEVSLFEFGEANAVARFRYRHAEFDYEVNYFDLTRAVAKRTTGWEKTQDARPTRRARVVQAALQRLADQSNATKTMGAAA